VEQDGAMMDSATVDVQRQRKIVLVKRFATTVRKWTAKLVDVCVLTDGKAQTARSVVRTETNIAIPASAALVGLLTGVTTMSTAAW